MISIDQSEAREEEEEFIPFDIHTMNLEVGYIYEINLNKTYQVASLKAVLYNIPGLGKGRGWCLFVA